MSDLQHLAAALPLPDPAFDAFWQTYLDARPDMVDGATLEITRAQLHTLFKLAFIAGREAATLEITHAK